MTIKTHQNQSVNKAVSRALPSLVTESLCQVLSAEGLLTASRGRCLCGAPLANGNSSSRDPWLIESFKHLNAKCTLTWVYIDAIIISTPSATRIKKINKHNSRAAEHRQHQHQLRQRKQHAGSHFITRGKANSKMAPTLCQGLTQSGSEWEGERDRERRSWGGW